MGKKKESGSSQGCFEAVVELNQSGGGGVISLTIREGVREDIRGIRVQLFGVQHSRSSHRYSHMDMNQSDC